MKALIITDVQNDFMPGGALAIPGANAIIPVINKMIPFFDHVFATLDWHPPHHVSFADTHKKQPAEIIQVEGRQQILWPIHCVQGTWGADFAEGLHLERIEMVFHKGTDPKVDSYSTFFDQLHRRSTGLADHLKRIGIRDLYFAGVATDYCVLYSVLDALELGFTVTVVRDGCRGIIHEEKAFQKMKEKGAKITVSSEIKKH